MEHNRGAALIMMIMIVAVMTVIATGLLKNSFLFARKLSNPLHRDQAYFYARGTELQAKSLVTQWLKSQQSEQPIVHNNQEWADPREYPVEGGVIKAQLVDRQNCFNLNSLMVTEQQQQGSNDQLKSLPAQLFLALLELTVTDLGIRPQVIVERVIDWIDVDQQPVGPDGAEDLSYLGLSRPYRAANQMMVSHTELRTVLGINAQVYRRLEPYICALPTTELSININTLDVPQKELLMMFFTDLDQASAEQLITARPSEGYRLDNFFALLGPVTLRDGAKELISATSNFFELQTHVTVGQGQANLYSLLERNGKAVEIRQRHTGI